MSKIITNFIKFLGVMNSYLTRPPLQVRLSRIKLKVKTVLRGIDINLMARILIKDLIQAINFESPRQ